MITNPATPSDGDAGDRAGHQHHDTEREADPGDDRPSTSRAAERRAAQRRGELRVLLDEGALHLLEQSELLFREWHRSSPRVIAGQIFSGDCKSRQRLGITVAGIGKFVTEPFRAAARTRGSAGQQVQLGRQRAGTPDARRPPAPARPAPRSRRARGRAASPGPGRRRPGRRGRSSTSKPGVAQQRRSTSSAVNR